MPLNLGGMTDQIGDLLPAAGVGAGKAMIEQKFMHAPAGTKPAPARVLLDAALALFGGSMVHGEWGQALTFAGGIGLGEDALGFAQSMGFLKTAGSLRVVRGNLVQPLNPPAGAPVRPYRYPDQAAENIA